MKKNLKKYLTSHVTKKFYMRNEIEMKFIKKLILDFERWRTEV